MKKFFNKIEIMSKLDSPFIIKFIGYSLKDFKDNSQPVIITEFVPNGSLEDILRMEQESNTPPEWNGTTKLKIIYGIATAMSYIHSKGIIHRNLRKSTILLDDQLLPKVSDFFLAVHENSTEEESLSEHDIISNRFTYPPEYYRNGKYIKASDVYAFSFILYEIITGKNPFAERKSSLAFWINAGIGEGRRPELDFPIPGSYKNLIEKCWADDPKERPTFDEIIKLLETDKNFIVEDMDEDEFMIFVEDVKDQF